MTRAPALCVFALAAFGAALPGSSFSQSERLQHDPFARPALANLQHGARLVPKDRGRAAAADPKRALNLQAVMVAGANSIANVDGIMVRIGEQIYGYRLIAVQERTAIFEKDGMKYAVSMRSNARVADAPGKEPDKMLPAEGAGAAPDGREERK
jgi:hypothetical protein